jgi:hypothetical protein
MMPTSHKILLSLKHVLSQNNTHERDQNLQFFEEGHKYVILNDSESKYTSVTTWNHSHFAKFDADKIIKNMMSGKNWKEGHKYWGQTVEQINALWANNATSASGAGTNMHYEIECFMNNDSLPAGYTHKELYDAYIKEAPDAAETSVEWKYFIQFVKDFPNLKPYRTEWTVYNEDLKLAGSIDMVYENPDGTLSIYDWKRVKEISRINSWNKYAVTRSICQMPDSNFWHYSLQLNTYKAILEAKYDKKVTALYLVRLHPEAEETSYELIKVPDLSDDIQTLFKDLNK